MLIALLILQVCAVGDTLILGAGPVGLWTAFKILQSDPNVQVVVAEKRQEFLSRDHIVVTYPFLMPELCDGTLKCPKSKITLGASHDVEDIKEISNPVTIKTVQASILERLQQYPSRFKLVKLKSMSGSLDLVKISLEYSSISNNIDPTTIIDATGSKAELMNGILKIPYNPDHYYTHGSALHFAWPSKLTRPNALVLGIQSNCQLNCPNDAISATAFFADPFENSNEIFTKWGFKVDPRAKPFSNANYDSERLNSLFGILSDHTVDDKVKSLIEAVFIDIQKGGKDGMKGGEIVSRLIFISWELDSNNPAYPHLIRLISDILMLGDLGSDLKNLEQLRVTFIPQRIEKHLTKIKTNNVPVAVDFDGRLLTKHVNVIVMGDALGTTDFTWGQGTNRGFSMATQIFKEGKEINKVYSDMVEHCFSKSGSWWDRSASSLNWILEGISKLK